ncbi:uncharacterized protein N7496_006757 [Penicillium cataractarum]|uniref:Major facilitator superfamily (MFS) profile domain-containing protein n=1 Tax=Penicillium cataractarum TaxID=2100454 RepID=A0A9W9S3I2_9EURO|nr:uncharacterized protein N7496_006757 [Penicillium cataractarum]KAJ5370665.1 hypothetical protein N7496_006757 [Penicillium cataractarum]
MSNQPTISKQKEVFHNENVEEIDPIAEKKLIRKIDLHLMSSVFILYLFSCVDRSNIGLAKIAGMEEDLGLTSDQYYTAVIAWVIGYTIAAVPSNMILSQTRPSLFIPVITFGWGAVAALLGVVQHQSHLIALRFLLGVFEAGFSPAVIFLISTWYRRSEHRRRHDSRNQSARALDSPGLPPSQPWVVPEELQLAQQRLLQDGMADPTGNGLDGETPMLVSFVKAVRDWRAWLLVPAYMSILGALAISYFYSTLIDGMGYSSTAAQYRTAPLYFVSLVVALLVRYFADHNLDKRGLFLAANLLVFLCFINMTIWTGNALGLSFATTALASVNRDMRAIMLALMNGIAALAQLYGSALFPAKDAPEYLVAFSVFAGTFAVGAILYGLADVLFKRYPYK